MEEFKCNEVKIDMDRVKAEAREVLRHVERNNYKSTKQMEKIYQGLAMVMAGLASLYANGAYRHYTEPYLKSLLDGLYGTIH